MIEKSIDALTEAVKANTEAILKLAGAGGAVASKPAESTGGKSKDKPKDTPPAGATPSTDNTPVKVTLADMRAAGLKAIEAGKQAEVKTLLESYGVPAVTKIPEDKFADALPKLKALVA